MRSDIAKVVVERPRSGGRDRPIRAYRRSVDWDRLKQEGREDDAPVTESITFRHGVGKRLNDFLSPIRGFLRKSVGRPWDDVWSEVSALLKPVSVMQRHVLEHLRDYVEINTLRQPDGTVTDSRGRELRSYFNRGAFYVDPDDGLLRQVPRTPRRVWRSRFGSRMGGRHESGVDPQHPFLQDENGAWFEVTLAPLPVTSSGWIVRGNLVSDDKLVEARKADRLAFYGVRHGIALGVAGDVWFRELAGPSVRQLVVPYRGIESVPDELKKHWKDGGILYCAAKRQLGKKDKKRLGLP